VTKEYGPTEALAEPFTSASSASRRPLRFPGPIGTLKQIRQLSVFNAATKIAEDAEVTQRIICSEPPNRRDA